MDKRRLVAENIAFQKTWEEIKKKSESRDKSETFNGEEYTKPNLLIEDIIRNVETN